MDAVLDLFRVLFEPAAVFGRVREKPRFLAPFLALAVITVVIGIVQLPFVKAAMTAQFTQTPNMTPEQAQTALKFAPIGVVIAPIAYCLFLLLNAFILWVGVSVFGGEAKFGTLLSVTTYASISYTLLQIVGVIVLMMRGTGVSRAWWTCSPPWDSTSWHRMRRASCWRCCAGSTRSRSMGCS